MVVGLFPAYDRIFCNILHGESNLSHGNVVPDFIMILNFQAYRSVHCLTVFEVRGADTGFDDAQV
jgi:hypothetical protein